MSSGALLDESVFEIISDACKELKKTVYLPSGAISGIDAIKSVKNELDSVVLTTTKHPNSLKGAKFFDDFKINLDEINEPSTIFEGTASEAVRLFPKNINVSALLSISGLGSHETIVKIIADPNTQKTLMRLQLVVNLVKLQQKLKMYLIPTILVQVDLQFYQPLKQLDLFVLLILKLEHNFI